MSQDKENSFTFHIFFGYMFPSSYLFFKSFLKKKKKKKNYFKNFHLLFVSFLLFLFWYIIYWVAKSNRGKDENWKFETISVSLLPER